MSRNPQFDMLIETNPPDPKFPLMSSYESTNLQPTSALYHTHQQASALFPQLYVWSGSYVDCKRRPSKQHLSSSQCTNNSKWLDWTPLYHSILNIRLLVAANERFSGSQKKQSIGEDKAIHSVYLTRSAWHWQPVIKRDTTHNYV